MALESIEGILLIDKPQGITSHDVVDRVRRALKIRKVGHAGTLDPMATGLLIILVGKATKVSQYLISLDKEYHGRLKFGEISDSHDADGEIMETRDVPELTIDTLEEHIKCFIGDQYQTPPMFSAKKIKGVPLYKLARKGVSVEREPRFIRVSEFELLRFESPDLEFRVNVSKGTYVRTLAHDLGEKVGCGAHLTALRRTIIDRFNIEDATELEALEGMSQKEIERVLIPVYQAVPSNLL